MRQWPSVTLEEVLTQDTDYVRELAPRLYPKLSVKLYGRGVVLDHPAHGSEVRMAKHQLAKPGQVILSEIWAKKGAIGIVPMEGNGALCTSHFFLFDINQKVALPTFVDWLLRGNYFEPQLGAEARGTTGYAAVRPKQFLEAAIPLPPLAEQQAIVAHLDALADKTRQLSAHLDAIEADAAAMLLSLHHRLSGGRLVQLAEIIELFEDPVPVTTPGQYPQVGVRGFGGGLFTKPAITAAETSYRAFNRLYTDAIVLSQVKGWEGALALCPPSLAGMFVSPEYRTFRCKVTAASAAYLGELFKTPWFWSLLQEATRGVGARRERTRPDQFLNVELPIPTLSNQIKAMEILSRQNQLGQRHAAIREANQALLPATLERLFACTGRSG